MSDWYSCAVCGMGHPWPLTEKLCPNEAIVRRTGLKGVPALNASGLFDRFEKPCPPLPVVDDPLSSAASTRPLKASTPASTPDDDDEHVDAGADARRKKAERQTRWRHNKAARALRQVEGVVAPGAYGNGVSA